jgi:hypothetical protein
MFDVDGGSMTCGMGGCGFFLGIIEMGCASRIDPPTRYM